MSVLDQLRELVASARHPYAAGIDGAYPSVFVDCEMDGRPIGPQCRMIPKGVRVLAQDAWWVYCDDGERYPLERRP